MKDGQFVSNNLQGKTRNRCCIKHPATEENINDTPPGTYPPYHYRARR